MTRRRKQGPIPYEVLYFYFAQELGNREGSFIDTGMQWATVVETGCGIDLHRPPLHNGGYRCTPANSVKFAQTGGDGCHFSFLVVDTEWTTASPVVMTCPSIGSY